ARTAEFATSLGSMLLRHERFAEAEAILRPALPPLEKAYGPASLWMRRASADLASALRGQGRCSEAEALMEKSLAACTSKLGPNHSGTLQVAGWLAMLQCEQGRYADA